MAPFDQVAPLFPRDKGKSKQKPSPIIGIRLELVIVDWESKWELKTHATC